MKIGTEIGYLNVLDEDKVDNMLSLVKGIGSKDNDKYELMNEMLKTKTMFNYEENRFYSIRISNLQSNGFTKEKVYVIRI